MQDNIRAVGHVRNWDLFGIGALYLDLVFNGNKLAVKSDVEIKDKL